MNALKRIETGWTLHSRILVLVVENCDLTRKVYFDFLSSRGHEVLVAKDVEEGLQLFQAHQKDLEVVILDGDLGSEKSGLWLAEQIRLHAPALPLVLASGNLDDIDQLKNRGTSSPFRKILCKPFPPQELEEVLKEVTRKEEEIS